MSIDGADGSEPSVTTPGPASHLPWHLIPIFEPGQSDLTEFTRRLEFLAGLWPAEHLGQLAPRAALQCKGSAFQKVVRIPPEKLKTNDLTGVKLLVQTLGGVWGKTTLEDKYEKFEQAIYGISQKSDESNESYMARHEIVFEDMISQGATLTDVRAYVLLRNSLLSAEDKKRLIVESKGDLRYADVTQAIRMLGAKFFMDVQGQQRGHKTKTYDVNYTQEADEEFQYGDDTNFAFTADASEVSDMMLDQFLNEGDEDALIVQQFEDALIDSVQGDGEMSAFMSTYLEARRRLTEKTRSRGFWPIRGKGSGKKGKSKPGFQRHRKPLAVRIAESDCRHCGQRGHWKAECPRRAVGSHVSNPQAKVQAANTVITSGLDVDDDADVYVMMPEAMTEGDVLVSVQDPSVAEVQSHSHITHVINHSVHDNGVKIGVRTASHHKHRHQGQFFRDVRQCMHRILKNQQPDSPARMPIAESLRTTPSLKTQRGTAGRSFDAHEFSAPEGEPEKKLASVIASQPEMAMFATTQTTGILDLGASQTVMGQHQVPEFLANLPTAVRELVQERPVNMSFRFGNNSLVPCHRALFVPIDRFWIKIAIVETQTPFLISNSVCRSLGAVIDTNRQRIMFKVLDCELPLELSSKRLFMLDFCALAACRPPRQMMSNEGAKHRLIAADTILHSQEMNHVPDDHANVPEVGSQVVVLNDPMKPSTNPHANPSAEPSKLQDAVTESQSSRECNRLIPAQQPDLAIETRPSCDSHPIVENNSCHVQARSSVSFRCNQCPADSGNPGDGNQEDDLRGTGMSDRVVWRSQEGSEVLRGGAERPSLLPLVPEEVGNKSQARTSNVLPVPDSVGRTQGTHHGSRPIRDCLNWQSTGEFKCVPQGQSQESWETFHAASAHRPRAGGRRMLGSPVTTHVVQRERECPAPGPSRRSTERSCESAEGAVSAHHRDASQQLASNAETFLIEQCIREYNLFLDNPGHIKQSEPVDPPRQPYRQNPILQEMIQYGVSQGWISQDGNLVGPKYPGIDSLEIYCSSDSQLTKQCIRQGLRAMRFGLKEGDLSCFEGRTNLYHVLFRYRPRNVWMSPKCKAWCKWNQFNANRSPEMANRVMRARQDDENHLLLCEAVFTLQSDRGPDFHFHLEQPIGSEMLYQECLQTIVANTFMTRCDLCTAGNLKHPISKIALQKGTQILTTSQIMHQYLGSLRCQHEHEHTHVAGSFMDKNGVRLNVSQFTEVYTQIFGHRIARTFAASKQVAEQSCVHAQTAFAGEMENEANEPVVKRRRLAFKVTNPPGYPEQPLPEIVQPNSMPSEVPPTVSENQNPNADSVMPREMLKQVLHEAMLQAPRVGTVVLQNGNLFDSLQKAFPERNLRVVELCKGADRYRKPPIKLVAHEAPWRRTLSLHRHSLEPDLSPWVQWDRMSNRQMCATAPPSRLMVTMFAKDTQGEKRGLQLDNPILMKKPRIDQPDQSMPDELDQIARKLGLDDNEGELQSKPHVSNGSPSSQEPKLDEEQSLDQLSKSTLKHGPKFLKLILQERQWLSKIHHNLGHPNQTKLQAVLKNQGFDDRLIQGLSDFQCGTCHEVQEPKIARPASLSEPKDFNDSVGCDLITWTSKSGKGYQFLHCLDAATSFQLAVPVVRTDAESLIESLHDCWFHWAGPCKQLIIDNASPLCSEQFSMAAQARDIHLRVVAAYAHWQMGKTERHGDILQDMLHKYDSDHSIQDEDQFKMALRHLCCAKNSLSRAQGYTPEILVLGKSRPLPGNTIEEVPTAAQFLAESQTPEGARFREQLQLRESARRAFISAENSEKLRRAFLRRQRPHRGNFTGGMFVMYWRPGKGESSGQWHGPARIIIQESQSVVWVTHASRVYRVAPEHIRCLSEREASQSPETLARDPIVMPAKVMGKGVFQYEDLTEVRPNVSIPNVPMVNDTIIPAPVSVENPNNEILQPDSEPGHIPSIPNSSGYSATPPISEISQNEAPPPELEDIPTDPKDVPVPDAGEDELVVEDFWISQGNQLIRVHKIPRTQAFEPTMTLDCPCDLLKIGADRITTGAADGQCPWSQADQWGDDSSRWVTEQPWTGITVFHVVQNGGDEIPETQDVMCMSTDQAFECEVFLTEDDIQSIQREPEEFSVLVATAAKRQRVEVKVKDLTPDQRIEFDHAKTKEIDQWLATETVRRILRHKIPDANILRCRWVLTWKDLDPLDAAREGKSRKAKARLVILGYEDPDITDIPRDSPTLQKESRSLLLQMCASQKWKIRSFDIKTAFLRGSRRDNRILGVDPPPEMRARMHLKEGETCELLKSAYGLVNAPYLWYQELKEELLRLNFRMSPLDPCLFSLADEHGNVHGLLGIHVDDGLCCGNSVFNKTIDQLEAKFPFGSKRDTDFTFTGIHIHQDQHYNIHLDQKEYVLGIPPISIDRQRRKNEQTLVTETERQGLRGLIGSLQYASINTRPDISAKLSFIQSRINCATIHDLLEANRLLGEAKKHAGVTVTISSIPINQVHLISYSDASFATREKKQSQKGGLILATHHDVFNQKSARASPLVWFSKKIDRVVASTLAAETFALSTAVDLLDWMRLAWEWIKCPLIPWKNPEAVWKKAPASIAVVDCKSLFDVISKNTTPQIHDHRTLIEALVIKDHLQSGIQPHWVHSAAQLADALTKSMDCFRIRDFLRHCSCCLHDVEEILKERADKKAHKTWLSQTASETTDPAALRGFYNGVK